MKVKNGSWSAAATPNFLIKVFSPQKKWPKTLIVWSNKKKRKFQKPIYRKLMNEQVITHCEIVIRIRGEWLFIVTSWCQNSLHTHCIVWKGFPSTRNFQRKKSSRFIIQRRQKKNKNPGNKKKESSCRTYYLFRFLIKTKLSEQKKVFTKPSHQKEAVLIPIQLLEQNSGKTKPRKNNNPKERKKKQQERKQGTGRQQVTEHEQQRNVESMRSRSNSSWMKTGGKIIIIIILVAVVILIAISRSPSLCFLLACDCENDDLRIESILARFWRTGLCSVALVLWVEGWTQTTMPLKSARIYF